MLNQQHSLPDLYIGSKVLDQKLGLAPQRERCGGGGRLAIALPKPCPDSSVTHIRHHTFEARAEAAACM